jgi:hypothetical protein
MGLLDMLTLYGRFWQLKSCISVRIRPEQQMSLQRSLSDYETEAISGTERRPLLSLGKLPWNEKLRRNAYCHNIPLYMSA